MKRRPQWSARLRAMDGQISRTGAFDLFTKRLGLISAGTMAVAGYAVFATKGAGWLGISAASNASSSGT